MKYSIDKDNMPLFKTLYCYKKQRLRLHMPGHKASVFFKKFFKDSCYDITELSFSDNLLKPDGIIKKAENLCCNCYGAEAVKFSSSGSTVNILALIYSLKDRASSLIIAKNSHKSVYSALKISNIEPIIIDNLKQKDNLYAHITPEDVEKALIENKNCIGAFITSPDYYGFFADLTEIAKVLKKHNKLLIADAAHGSHLPFLYKDFYKEADVYLCSAHKTLLALTPAAFTVFNNYTLYDSFIKSLNIFHTTSPSYSVLSSLDFAREFMQKNGYGILNKLKTLSNNFCQNLKEIGFNYIKNDDFTKILITKEQLTGYEIAQELEKKGIYCELADENLAMALFTVADSKKQFDLLLKALKGLKINIQTATKSKDNQSFSFIKVMPYLAAANSNKESIPLEKAADRTAADDVGLFPPSYPLICCGEKITQSFCDFVNIHKEHTFGLDNGYIVVVK